MKKIFLALLALCPLFLSAQEGLIKESLKIKSAILGREVEYSIYLPADYEQSNRHYPVLYLLHGYTDDEAGWTQFGEVDRIADDCIQKGDAAPMVIAMPDGGVGWYINSVDGKNRYEDFFIQEFIPFIETTYRCRSEKRFRAISGLSMGGYGTLIMALKHPELFAAAAPLSAAVFTDEDLMAIPQERWNTVLGQPLGKDVEAKDRLSAYYYQNSPLKIAETADSKTLETVRFYIDCGDDDFLIKGNMALNNIMIDKKIPHEFRVRDGAHNWTYWRTALPVVLGFVSDSFRQK